MNKRTALLVIDAQLCAFDSQLEPACYKSEELLEVLTSLIQAARTADIPVIFIQHCGSKGQLYEEGTEHWIIHPQLGPKPSETVVHKRQSSAFDGTNLKNILAELHIDSVITCGLQSEFCVSNTSFTALDLGLNVTVAEDGHSTWSNDSDDAATIIQRQNMLLTDKGAKVMPLASLIERFASS
ncbi:MAG: hypothetical protein COA96_14475 [SAR86 cluster bacterium]|uniref:Isochorismatase-like domain-containing protein n=1 Tax=SAR86 cluster bacterium TaxID=2030880 RepID=A0A2A5ASZ6_9GAMM|nr:MAG: hypothetical protein COA96_14475 [SAR86 cluster bacterium]